MNVRTRMISLKLVEKEREHPKYMEEIGVTTKIRECETVTINQGKSHEMESEQYGKKKC